MLDLSELEERTDVPLLVTFADLTHFAAESRQRSDRATADMLDEYYGRVASAVEGAEGTVVKFIGDAALIVHTELSIDRGALALLDLKTTCDNWLASRGSNSRLQIKTAFGPVVAGPFGPRGNFDVVGNTVNDAARLRGAPVVFSDAAFRKLGPELQLRLEERTGRTTHVLPEQ